MLPAHTILFPTDLSELAAPAFELACALARDEGARLVVLYVVPPPSTHGEVVARRQPDGFYEGLWRQLRELHAPEGDVRVEPRLEEGDAVEEILRVAREVHAGIIVMGTHGRGGLSRLVLGSVAEQVLRRADCPVLTVKVPAAAAVSTSEQA
jgi:nucleotide-binding universal stress UspA family protein